MSTSEKVEAAANQSDRELPVKDFTGRSGLVRNAIFSWGSQFVLIAAGFVMPRIINQRLGQDILGVWDFAWSLISYFYFIDAGITSAVNRYVGRHWARQEIPEINRVLSCASCALMSAGALLVLLALALSALLPKISGGKFGASISEAQGVVIFLGLGLGVQTALGAFNGVLTGCHRWDLKNINQAVWHLITVVSMVVVLMLGGGLLQLSMVTCLGGILGECSRVALAFRVCPGLRLRWSLVQWQTIRELYAFGGKTLIPTVSDLLQNSTTSMMIVSFLGPAALALYTRPRSLVRHADTLVRRMTMPVIPTLSSLQACGDVTQLRDLVIKAVRYTLYLVLPILLVIGIFGGPLLHLWMGPAYANGILVAVLAAGLLAPIAATPLVDILTGLNAHGRAGIAQLCGGILSASLVMLALGPLHLGLIGAAVGVTLPPTLISTVYYPMLICPKVGLRIREFYRLAVGIPLLRLLPFALGLAIVRWAFMTSPLTGAIVSVLLLGPMLLFTYWKHVIPKRMKVWISTRARSAIVLVRGAAT